MRSKSSKLIMVAFLLPSLVLYLLFVIYPTIDTFRVSLYRWSAVSPSREYIGFENFAKLSNDHIYWKALLNNFLITTLSIGLCLPISLFLANSLAKSTRTASLYRAILPFPNMLGDVAVAVVWLFIYLPTFGLLNSLLKQMGLGSWARAWLGNKGTALVAVTLPLVWKWLGFYTLLLLGGILTIDREIFEAAVVDGANEWKKFWLVTFPLIKQNLVVAILFMIVFSFNAVVAFTRVMTQGGPDRATETVPSYLVKQAFEYSNFGYAAAIGVTMLLIVVIVCMPVIRTLLRRGTD